MESELAMARKWLLSGVSEQPAVRMMERRSRTIARLEEQKLLLNNPNYVRNVRSFVKTSPIQKCSVFGYLDQTA